MNLESDYNFFKQLYLNEQKSLSYISRKYNISRWSLTKRLKLDGIKIVNRQNEQSLYQDFFEVINTEEKAYWLGFLYADGYVSKNSNHIELSLQLSDINHLIKFSKAINFTNNIIKDYKVPRCRICFACKKMHKDLVNQGCVPQKSLILNHPENVPEELVIHFIRGYFDGDGSVSFNERKHHRPSLQIIGTEDVLSWISEKLNKKVNRKRKDKRTENDKTLCMSYSGEKAREILFMLYKNANVYLDRKYERFCLMKTALLDSDVQYALGKIGKRQK